MGKDEQKRMEETILRDMETMFGAIPNSGDPALLREHFFGSRFRFSYRQLIYFLFHLEKEWNIAFDETDFDQDRIYSIQSLAQLVLEKQQAEQPPAQEKPVECSA